MEMSLIAIVSLRRHWGFPSILSDTPAERSLPKHSLVDHVIRGLHHVCRGMSYIESALGVNVVH